MIISNIQLNYDARNGQKSAFIKIEVKNWLVSPTGITYTTNDYAVNGEVKELINVKEVFYSWDQINSLNSYLESQNQYLNLNKKEIEYLKVKHALLLETQTNPIYSSTPSQWILTENDEI